MNNPDTRYPARELIDLAQERCAGSGGDLQLAEDDDDLEARVSRSVDGAWVKTWLWVPYPEQPALSWESDE